jgi:hypothetical protein
MESKDSTFYPLIVLFFVLGLVIGYVIHQPETQIKYINNTIEVPTIVEKTVGVTASPTSTAQTPTPTSTQVPDFEVKIYDPEKDKPTKTIEINNWQAVPDQMSIRPGQTVLFQVVNYPQRAPPNFIMGSYERKLGTAGQIVITFNKIGTYDFRVVIPSDNPGSLPTEYAKGSIRIY